MGHLNTVKRQIYENHMVFRQLEKNGREKGVPRFLKMGVVNKGGSAKKGEFTFQFGTVVYANGEMFAYYNLVLNTA